MPHRGSTTSPHLSMQLEPSLAPHDGLPGQHGTSRFCYGIIASKSGGGMKAGALAAAIHKAEQAAGSASPCSRGAKAGGGGGLLVGPAITLDALAAPGAPAPGGGGGDTTGVGGVAVGFDPATGAYAGTTVGEAKVAGTAAPA
jgi:hypothetical protein